ncbi:MAG: 4Fe-4S dicluster domain-containing protein [Dethiobacteria bacterium]|jgi:NAD-dependent dihydropyrimidine dehydrogenase PreA subunit|nr:ferredoxin family protein [Bacillota bacterium]
MAVEVDKKLCKKCRICIEMCPKGALDVDADGTAYLAHPDKCTLCELCSWVCPDFAVDVKKEK